MNSPVYHYFGSIQLDKSKEQPLYEQLIDEMAKAIQLGVLPHNTKLPGSRVIAEFLGIHRNTVLKSLDELAAMGYIQVLPNQGSYVAQPNGSSFAASINQSNHSHFPEIAPFGFEKNRLLDTAKNTIDDGIGFNQGERDFRLMEWKISARYYSSVLRKSSRFFDSGKKENAFFFKQMVNYLYLTQNIRVTPNQIMIARSEEVIHHVLGRVLGVNHKVIGVSDLDSSKINMFYQANGFTIERVKSDEKGICLNTISSFMESNHLKVLHLDSHQLYPTTLGLSDQSKWELLKICENHKGLLIESSLYSDYYYGPRRERSMGSLQHSGNIVSIGEIGGELAPGLGFFYLIGASDFIEEAKKHQLIFENPISPLSMQIMAELIADGELIRIQKKHRKIYMNRRAHMGNLLIQYFGNEIELSLPKSGLDIWLKWKSNFSLMELRKNAKLEGLDIPMSTIYQTKDMNAMRIGFGHLKEEEIESGVKRLFHAYLKTMA